MDHQFAKAIMRPLHVILLIVMLTSMNACMIANYQVTAQESSEKRPIWTSRYDEVVQFVIPRYHRVESRCRGGGRGWLALINVFGGSCREEHDFIGTQVHDGLLMALDEMPLGKPAEFIEHIRSQGLVCVVTVNEQINDDIPYSELLSLATLFTVPACTTHKYILGYSLLFDFKTVKEYEHHITEKAISGWISWLLFPVMYSFWDDIKLNLTEYGPRASVIKETTKTFLREAHREGIL